MIKYLTLKVMKKEKLADIFYRLFDDPLNGQVCKWTVYVAIGYFTTRALISLIFGI